MKQKLSSNNTATFTLDVPVVSAHNVVCTNHQLSLSFSADVNAGTSATVSVKALGGGGYEPVDDGTYDAYALRGKTRTVCVYGLVLESIQVTLAGRTAGSVTGAYTGYGAGDPGRDDAYVT